MPVIVFEKAIDPTKEPIPVEIVEAEYREVGADSKPVISTVCQGRSGEYYGREYRYTFWLNSSASRGVTLRSLNRLGYEVDTSQENKIDTDEICAFLKGLECMALLRPQHNNPDYFEVARYSPDTTSVAESDDLI